MTTLADIAKAQSDYDYAVAQVPTRLAALTAAKAAYVPPAVPSVGMRLVLVNELLNDKDLQQVIRFVQAQLPEVLTCFPELGIKEVVGETWLDPQVFYVPTGKDFVVYLTERNTHTGAAYHDFVKNPDGTRYPVAWCSLRQSGGSVFGKITHPKVVPAHKVGLLNIPTRTYGTLKVHPGLATSVMHEIIEASANPWLDKFSGTVAGTTLDAQGRAIFFEVCDPIESIWDIWTDPQTKQEIVSPPFVFTDWYNLNAAGPVCSDGSVTKPFQMSKGGMSFWRNLLGIFTKV